MAVEFQSNPLASFLNEYNWKVQFNCTQFYADTPLVTCSDPLITVVNYNLPANYFQFYLQADIQNFNGILLTPMLLTPPVQMGRPIIIPQYNYGLWWGYGATVVNGNSYPLITIGAEQNSAGRLAQIPDVVLAQIILNTDIRYEYPTAAAAPV